MTDTQMALLLAAIWVAPHAGPRHSFAMGLVFLFFAIYIRWF